MHYHIGFISAFNIFLMVLIIGFFWRTLAHLWAGTAVGEAMAYLY